MATNSPIEDAVKRLRDEVDTLSKTFADDFNSGTAQANRFEDILTDIKTRRSTIAFTNEAEEARFRQIEQVIDAILQSMQQAADKGKIADSRDIISKLITQVQSFTGEFSDSEDHKAKLANADTEQQYAEQISILSTIASDLKSLNGINYSGNTTKDETYNDIQALHENITSTVSDLQSMQKALTDLSAVPRQFAADVKILEEQLGMTTSATQELRSALQNVFEHAAAYNSSANTKIYEEINTQAISAQDAIEKLANTIKFGESPQNVQDISGLLRQAEFVSSQVNELHRLASGSNSQLADTSLNSIADIYSHSSELASILDTSYIVLNGNLQKIKQQQPNEDYSEVEAELAQLKQRADTERSSIADNLNRAFKLRLDRISQSIDSGVSDALNQFARGRNLGNKYSSAVNRAGQSAADVWQSIAADEQINKRFSIFGYEFGPRGTNFGTAKDDLSFISQAQFEMQNSMPQLVGIFDQAMQKERKGDILASSALKKQGEAQFRTAVDAQIKLSDRAKAAMEKWQSLSKAEQERWGGKDTERKLEQLITQIQQANLALIQTQAAYDINVDDATKKQLKALGKDANKFREIKEEINNTENTAKQALARIKGFAQDVASGIRNAAYKTKSILDKFGGLGMALMGPIDTVLQSIKFHREQGQRRYAAMGVDASIGYDLSDSASRAQSRLMTGNQLYVMSGGMIKREEIDDLYKGLVKSVGGHYGGTPTETVHDMEQLSRNLTPLKTVYGVSESTLQNAVKTYYKDMGMSASETEDAIARLTIAAQNANVPLESYLNKVTSIAQTFMKIGIDGQKAGVILNNLMSRGIRADVAEEIASQAGAGLAKFAENENLVAFSGMMLGMNPFTALAKMSRTHDEHGNPRKAWVNDAIAMADTATHFLTMPYGNDPDMHYWGLVRTYKQQFGFSQRTAATLASAAEEYGTDSETFKQLFEEKLQAEDNPNAKLEALNDKILNQLKSMTNQLAASDKLKAQLEGNLYSAAGVIGAGIDKIVNEIAPILLAFQQEMMKWTIRALAFLSKLVQSDAFKQAIDSIVDVLTNTIPNALKSIIDTASKGIDGLRDFFGEKDENGDETASGKIADAADTGVKYLEIPAALAAGAAAIRNTPGSWQRRLGAGVITTLSTGGIIEAFRRVVLGKSDQPEKDAEGNVKKDKDGNPIYTSPAERGLHSIGSFIDDHTISLPASAWFLGKRAIKHAPGLWKIPAFIGGTLFGPTVMELLEHGGGTVAGTADQLSQDVQSDTFSTVAGLIAAPAMLKLGYAASNPFTSRLATTSAFRGGLGKFGIAAALGYGIYKLSNAAFDYLLGPSPSDADQPAGNKPPKHKSGDESSWFGGIFDSIFGVRHASAAALYPEQSEYLKPEPVPPSDNSPLGLYATLLGLYSRRTTDDSNSNGFWGTRSSETSNTGRITNVTRGRSTLSNIWHGSREFIGTLGRNFRANIGNVRTEFNINASGIKASVLNTFDNRKLNNISERLRVLTDQRTALQAEVNQLHQSLTNAAPREQDKITRQLRNLEKKLSNMDVEISDTRSKHTTLSDRINRRNAGFLRSNGNISFKDRLLQTLAPESYNEHNILKNARAALQEQEAKLISQRGNNLRRLVELESNNNRLASVLNSEGIPEKDLTRVTRLYNINNQKIEALNKVLANNDELLRDLKYVNHTNADKVITAIKKSGDIAKAEIITQALQTNGHIGSQSARIRNKIITKTEAARKFLTSKIFATGERNIAATTTTGKTLLGSISLGFTKLKTIISPITTAIAKLAEHFKIPGISTLFSVSKGGSGILSRIPTALKMAGSKLLNALPIIGVIAESGFTVSDIIENYQRGDDIESAIIHALKKHAAELGLSLASLIPGGSIPVALAGLGDALLYLFTGKTFTENVGIYNEEEARAQRAANFAAVLPPGSEEIAELVSTSQLTREQAVAYAGMGAKTKKDIETIIASGGGITADDAAQALQNQVDKYRTWVQQQENNEPPAESLESENISPAFNEAEIIAANTPKDVSTTDDVTRFGTAVAPPIYTDNQSERRTRDLISGDADVKSMLNNVAKSPVYTNDARKILENKLPQYEQQRKALVQEKQARLATLDQDHNLSTDARTTLKKQVEDEYDSKISDVNIKQDNLLVAVAGATFTEDQFDESKFDEKSPDKTKSRWGSTEERADWEKTTGNIAAGLPIDSNSTADKPETREEAARSRGKVGADVSKKITDEQKNEHKLSLDRNKLLETFIKKHTELMGKFQDSVTSQHGNLWKMLAVTHQILFDLNKTIATGAAVATSAILKSGRGGSPSGTNPNSPGGNYAGKINVDQTTIDQFQKYADTLAGTSVNPNIVKFLLREAAKHNLSVDDTIALFSFASAESQFDQNATSSVGAIGVMQLMPETAAGLGVDPSDTEQNIIGGVQYWVNMRECFRAQYGDNAYDIFAAAYNAGPGAVEEAGGVPNYSETQAYIADINRKRAMANGIITVGQIASSNQSANPVNGQGAIAFGDSIFAEGSAKDDLEAEIPGILVDAVVSRSLLNGGFEELQTLVNNGRVGNTVIMEMGTNGFSEDSAKRAIELLGSNRQIYWANTYNPGNANTRNTNETLQRLADQYENVHIIDWHKLAKQHPEWFESDHEMHLHPNEAGQRAYAQLVKQAIGSGSFTATEASSSGGLRDVKGDTPAPSGRTFPLIGMREAADCTAVSSEMVLTAWTGKNWEGELNTSTWLSAIRQYGKDIDVHSYEEFEHFITEFADKHPNVPLAFYQTGAPAHDGNAINGGSGSHMVAMIRQADGKWRVHDPAGGGQVKVLNVRELWDAQAGQGFGRGNQDVSTGHMLVVPNSANPVSNIQGGNMPVSDAGGSRGALTNWAYPSDVPGLTQLILAGQPNNLQAYYDPVYWRQQFMHPEESANPSAATPPSNDTNDGNKSDPNKSADKPKRMTTLGSITPYLDIKAEFDPNKAYENIYQVATSTTAPPISISSDDIESRKRLYEFQKTRKDFKDFVTPLDNKISFTPDKSIQQQIRRRDNLTEEQLLQYYGISLSDKVTDEDRTKLIRQLSERLTLGKGLNGEDISSDELQRIALEKHLSSDQARAYLYATTYQYKDESGKIDDRISYTGEVDNQLIFKPILPKLSARPNSYNELQQLISERPITRLDIEKQYIAEKRAFGEPINLQEMADRVARESRTIPIKTKNARGKEIIRYTNARGKSLYDKSTGDDIDTIISDRGMNGQLFYDEDIRFMQELLGTSNLAEARNALSRTGRYAKRGEDLLAHYGISLDKKPYGIADESDPNDIKYRLYKSNMDLLAGRILHNQDLHGHYITKQDLLNEMQKIRAEAQSDDDAIRAEVSQRLDMIGDDVIQLQEWARERIIARNGISPEDLPTAIGDQNKLHRAGMEGETNWSFADYSQQYARWAGLDQYEPKNEEELYDIRYKQLAPLQSMNGHMLYQIDYADRSGGINLNERGGTNLGIGSQDIVSAMQDATGLKWTGLNWTISNHTRTRNLLMTSKNPLHRSYHPVREYIQQHSDDPRYKIFSKQVADSGEQSGKTVRYNVNRYIEKADQAAKTALRFTDKARGNITVELTTNLVERDAAILKAAIIKALGAGINAGKNVSVVVQQVLSSFGIGGALRSVETQSPVKKQ